MNGWSLASFRSDDEDPPTHWCHVCRKKVYADLHYYQQDPLCRDCKSPSVVILNSSRSQRENSAENQVSTSTASFREGRLRGNCPFSMEMRSKPILVPVIRSPSGAYMCLTDNDDQAFVEEEIVVKIKEVRTCVICAEEEEEGGDQAAAARWLKLSCGHVYHEECILKWLKSKNSCPICRCEKPNTG